MSARFDTSDDSVFVVIGSGAGGGTLSNELAQKGVKTVCLEAGNRLEMADIVNDPAAMDKKMGWHDPREGAPTWLCKTVGGTTMRWSAMALRFRPYEMRPLSTYGEIKGTDLIDWPITYEALEPYYVRAEAKMGVSGTGNIAVSPETNNYKVLKAGGARAGFKDMTTAHLAINPEFYDGRPGCQQIGFCYSGCAIAAKWSTLYTEIPKAEATGNFELRPGCMVTRINHDARGVVSAVTYIDADGVEQEQKTRGVAVAGNVVETARLLLNSNSNMFPKGLGNASDHVGRHYMKHQHSTVVAIMPGEVNAHRGARQTGIILDPWKHDASRGFAGGYNIQTSFGQPSMMAAIVGGWGEELAEFMENYTRLTVGFGCGEDLPDQNNRISLHDTKTDDYGLPVPVLSYAQHGNAKAMEEHCVKAMHGIYDALGAEKITRSHGNVSTCHNMGGARMSDNPEAGVTNKWGQVHDIPNLFVSDGSVFPSSGAANPTLTIVALTIRQAEFIAAQMARGEF